MQSILKLLLSFSLFIILVVGVTGYYYQIHAKPSITRLSNFSDNNEEDLHKEDFIKQVIFEDLGAECFFLPLHQSVLFLHPPDCILEGHTGLVTPPPWC